MMKKLLLAGAAALALLSGTQAHAAIHNYADVGNWHVRYNDETGGCSMMTDYSRGTRVVLRWSPSKQSWAMLIGNDGWTNISEGSQHTVTFILDGYDKWTGTFTGNVTKGGEPFMSIWLKDEAVVALMKRYKAELYGNDGKFITGLPLTDTYAAALKVIECQQRWGR